MLNGEELDRQRILPWHWSMLNDGARNQAYQRAIARACSQPERPVSTAIDIGCGCGLLTVLLAQQGVERVLACEIVPELAELAAEVAAQNGVPDHQLHVFQGHSCQLQLPDDQRAKQRGSPVPAADLIVTETMDECLFGEEILSSLSDARRRLLKPGGVIIPACAVVTAVAVGFDASFRAHTRCQLPGVVLCGPHGYTSRDASVPTWLHQQQLRWMSEPFTALRVQFGESKLPQASLQLTATAEGSIDGFAYWWRVGLDDETWVSNEPAIGAPAGKQQSPTCLPQEQQRRGHWSQAVFVLPEPFAATVGAKLELQVGVSDTKPSYFPADMRRHRIHFSLPERLGKSQRSEQLPTVTADLSMLNSSSVYSAHTHAVQALAACHSSLTLAVEGWQAAVLIERALAAGIKQLVVFGAPTEPLFGQLFAPNGAAVRLYSEEGASISEGSDAGTTAALVSLVDPRSGCIRPRRLRDWQQLREKHGVPAVEPSGLELWAQAVQCAYIECHTELREGAVPLSVDLSRLQVHRPPELCVRLCEHNWVALSAPIRMAAAVPCGEVGRFQQQLPCQVQGVLHCIVVWFVELWGGRSVDFGPSCEESHACQLAFMPPSFERIQAGDQLLLECATDDELVIASVRRVEASDPAAQLPVHQQAECCADRGTGDGTTAKRTKRAEDS